MCVCVMGESDMSVCVCYVCERYECVCERETSVFEMLIWVCVCIMCESDKRVCERAI